MRFLFALVFAFALVRASLLSDEAKAKMLSKPMTWTPDFNNKFASLTKDEARRMMGLDESRLQTSFFQAAKNGYLTPYKATGVALPDNFDSRVQWPGCVHQVRDQGACGSCWAFGAVESVSDRFCVASNHSVDVRLSTQQLVSCNLEGMEACGGGEPITAMRYISMYGLPLESCVPYVSGQNGDVPDCPSSCVNSSQPFNLFSTQLTSLKWHITVEGAQEDVFASGPVEACFSVYEDFMSYASGVYQYTTGDYLGGHCVEIVGWGVTSSNVPYWIVRNSWGPSWGMKGYFWIRRGTNECGFEREVFSVLPTLS